MNKKYSHGELNLHNKNNGAAMTEFIIAAIFFLLPLFLAVQALGKFADVQATANMAARYLTWEKTVWYDDKASNFYTINNPNQKSTDAIHREMTVRVINDRRNSLTYTSNDMSSTSFSNGVDPLWEDTKGDGYLAKYTDITATATKQKPSKDVLGGAIGVLSSFSVPGLAGPFIPPLPNDNLVVSEIKFDNVAKDSEVYKRLWSKAYSLPTDWTGQTYQARGAILSNTWAANGHDSTKEMVAKSVLTHQGLGKVAEAAVKIGMAGFDPMAALTLDLQVLEPDVVPDDRLK